MKPSNERLGREIIAESSGVFGVFVTMTSGDTYPDGSSAATIMLLDRDEALALMAEIATAIATTDDNRASRAA